MWTLCFVTACVASALASRSSEETREQMQGIVFHRWPKGSCPIQSLANLLLSLRPVVSVKPRLNRIKTPFWRINDYHRLLAQRSFRAHSCIHCSESDSEAATTPLYLQDAFLLETSATVVGLEETEAGWVATLDATVFHPQGGGQPSDVGTIGGVRVVDVFTRGRAGQGGTIFHLLAKEPLFAIGELVVCSVDAEHRTQNTRAHSAGHLIDSAMQLCGIGLEPTKGYHWPEGPYVEYADPPETRMTPDEREALLPKLQSALDELIANDSPTEVSNDEAGTRIVTIGGVPCPCGGTHVDSSSRIGPVTIVGLKSKGSGKKKALRVSYRMGNP